MILIKRLIPHDDFSLEIEFEDKTIRKLSLTKYLKGPAFKELNRIENFKRVKNCGYYVEWVSGQDLSADTLYYTQD